MPTLEDLHRQLLAGDLRAASKIVEHTLPALVRLVAKAVPGLHNGHDDACLEVLLDYLQNPSRYDPNRSSLLTFLTREARSQANTAFRAQARRQKYEQAYVTDRDVTVGNETRGEDEVTDIIYMQQLFTEHWSTICQSGDDEEVFLLMAAGERFFPPYLDALGLEDTPNNRKLVESHRERLRGRVRRLQPRLQP